MRGTSKTAVTTAGVRLRPSRKRAYHIRYIFAYAYHLVLQRLTVVCNLFLTSLEQGVLCRQRLLTHDEHIQDA